MIKLISTGTNTEIFVGQQYALFSILAIDYVNKCVLITDRKGKIAEFNNSWRYKFV